MSSDLVRREAVQYEQFKAFADGYVAEHGREPSIRAAVAALGGSNTTISSHKRAWLTHNERLGGDLKLSSALPEAVVRLVTESVGHVMASVWETLLIEQQAVSTAQTQQLAAQHEQYLEEIERIQLRLANQVQQTKDAQKDYQHERDERERVEEALKSVTDERNELAQTLAAATARSDAHIVELTKENDDLLVALDDNRKQVVESHGTISQLDNQLAVCTQKYESEQNRQTVATNNYLKQLSDQEERFSNELKAAEQQNQQRDQQLEQEKAARVQSEKQLSLAQKEVVHAQAQSKSLSERLKLCEQHIVDRDKQLTELMTEKQKDAQSIETQLAKMEKRLLKRLKGEKG